MHPAATPDFWRERWALGQIGFHEGQPNASLTTWWPRLGVAPGARVLVPLCGKTVDLSWLAGVAQPVGVELSELAVRAIFDERGTRPSREQRGAHRVYTDGAIEARHGDFFDTTGTFDAAWDRAALIALPPDVRPRYAAHLRGLLRPGGVILCVTLGYDGPGGPPFAVHDAEVRALYAGCAVSQLHRAPLDEPRFAGKNAYSSVWSIRT